jgi:hypothetical protein
MLFLAVEFKVQKKIVARIILNVIGGKHTYDIGAYVEEIVVY